MVVIDIEQIILGAILIDPDAYALVGDKIKRNHFSTNEHSEIFDAITELADSSIPIDILTVTERLSKKKKLKSVGGVNYIVSLTSRVGSSANIMTHARFLKDRWKKRSIQSICDDILNMEDMETIDADELLNEVESKLILLMQEDSNDRTQADIVKSVIDSAEAIRKSGGSIGTNLTGINSLEKILNGAEPGDLIIVSGRPGRGKSSIFNNILVTAYRNKTPIYEWSGEMTPEMRVIRMVANICNIDSRMIRNGQFLDMPQSEDVFNTLHAISDANMRLDFGMKGLSEIVSTIILEKKKRGTSVFLIDRLELINLSKINRDLSVAKQIVTATLRNIANELKITIVMAAQMRKTADENKFGEPNVIDILDTTSIINDATKIILIHNPSLMEPPVTQFRDGTSSKGMGELIVAKNTNGRQDRTRVVFDGKYASWSDVEEIGLSKPYGYVPF